jgi:LacI family transcriptional regulator, galactose operon repressor
MPRTTIHDVAKAAGVSAMTVSRVLNAPDVVAEATRQRVRDAINDLGFVRNASARQLRDGRSLAVGLVIVDIDNPYFAEFAHGVEDAVNDEGYVVILCNSARSAAREERHLRLLEEQRVEGVLIFPVSTATPALLQRMQRAGAGTVLINHRSRRKDQCWVSVNDILGGRLAAQHLLDLGHRRIGLINGQTTVPQPGDDPHKRSLLSTIDRRKGFLASLADAGVKLAAAHDVETEVMGVSEGEQAAGRLLDRGKPPTALFCGNDLLAVGALRAATARGLSIPDDLAIMGYDDVDLPGLWTVPLTSIRQPIYDLGHRAARLLLEEARDGASHQHQHILFNPELVARESTVGRTGGQNGA